MCKNFDKTDRPADSINTLLRVDEAIKPKGMYLSEKQMGKSNIHMYN